jgi:GNAT superfamily N-acetyltransferase
MEAVEHVALANPDEVGDAVKLVRSAFPPELMALSIYQCTGIADWLASQLGLPDARRPLMLLVARSGQGKPVAMVDMRRNGPSAFLSYIATAEAWRGRGLGTRLLRRALQNATDRWGSATLELDVSEQRPEVASWYATLGLTVKSQTHWRHDDLTAGHEPIPGATIHGFPEADSIHGRFGFSQFQVQFKDGTSIQIGRLGSQWFRVAEPPSNGLRRVLNELDPHRQILFTATDAEAGGRPHATVWRAPSTRCRRTSTSWWRSHRLLKTATPSVITGSGRKDAGTPCSSPFMGSE